MPPNAKTRRRGRQTRASPAASTGCAVFAKAGFLCDNKRHPFGNINRPVGAAGAQVPYKHKVTGSNPVPATIKIAGQTFFSDLFFFQGNQGKQVPDKLAAIDHARLPPIHCAHKNGRRLTPTPENQRAFTLKARLSSAGKRTRLPLYGPRTHRCPGENPPYAPQARSLHANQKGRRLSRRPSSYAISIWRPGKPRSDATRLHGASAPLLIPLACPSRPRASRAHGQAMPPWRRRRAYGRSRRAARRRTTAAGRSGASRRRRLSW